MKLKYNFKYNFKYNSKLTFRQKSYDKKKFQDNYLTFLHQSAKAFCIKFNKLNFVNLVQKNFFLPKLKLNLDV
jgi:hypothetical protein